MAVDKPGGIAFKKAFDRPAPASPEKKLRDVSDMYEKHFLREMVKAMRSTVSDSGFIKANQAEKIFREQLDDEYVEKWGQQGGIGFSDLIYQQLMDKFGPALGKKPLPKPVGPMALSEKNQSTVKFEMLSGANKKQMDIKISPQQGAWPQLDVVSPWSGKVLSSRLLGPEQNLIEIDHGQGLLGKYIFKGHSANFGTDGEIEAGQNLGRLSPEASAFYWNLSRPEGLE